MHFVLALFALLGHAFLWIGLVNRLHALGVQIRTVKIVTVGCFLCAVLIPIGIAWQYATTPAPLATTGRGFMSDAIAAYIVVCWIVVPVTLLRLVGLRFLQRSPPIVRFHGRRRVEISTAAAAGELPHHRLARLPRNEILQLEVTQWVLDVPRLAPALDGLSIVHLSDLHFTGRVGKAYFREVVRVGNELQPDLVCITGDIIDRAACFDWIGDTLGQLAAPHGVYFVLGNHDRRVDVGRLRRTLESHGLVDLGGRCLPIEIRGTPVGLAGNERPWFDGCVGCVQHTDQLPRENGAFHASYALRIALAHTPDQFAWARAQDADLMLAGHTHGGQIRVPPLGAILSPTAEGVKYISGVFYVPPTILHVTRGLSGDVPLRWNCRPEIAHLRLRAGALPNVPSPSGRGLG